METPSRRVSSIVRSEQGFALVFALLAMVVLGIAATSVAAYTTSGMKDSVRSGNDQVALALAEAGLNMAYSSLAHASNPGTASALSSTSVPDVQMTGGTSTYFGQLSGQVWTLTGVGKVADPGAPGHTIIRQVTGKAQVSTGTVGGAANAAWKYIYSDDPNSCATLSNNTKINVPIYVQGSLCLNNSAVVDGPAVQVGGRVTLNNTQTSIGTLGSPMTEIHIAKGCSLTGVLYDTPCTSADRVYGVNPPDTNVTPLSKPPINIASWYQNAMPGPMHPCTTGSFPGGFDNDTTLNRSLTTSVNLFPKTAYDCRVLDASGNLVGRLAWTPGTPGTLNVQGTIFFDGNIVTSQLTQAQYQGLGTIYASGTISMQNQTSLCPVTGCGSNWDPNQNLLTLVAGSSTDQVGFSIGNNSTFAGAVYCVNDYSAGNASSMWGPIIARQINISNSTMNDFPPIMNLMPGMPSSYSTVTTVSVVQGSWGS